MPFIRSDIIDSIMETEKELISLGVKLEGLDLSISDEHLSDYWRRCGQRLKDRKSELEREEMISVMFD